MSVALSASALGQSNTSPRGSLDTVCSTRSRKEYLDSLVPPSKEDFERISNTQRTREAEHRRRSKEHRRRSAEVARRSMDCALMDANAAKAGSNSANAESPVANGRRAELHSTRLEATDLKEVDDSIRHRAAVIIQKTYRGHRARREIKGHAINSTTRWVHAIREAQFRAVTKPRARSSLAEENMAQNDEKSSELDPMRGEEGRIMEKPSGDAASRSATAKRNWRKAAVIARRAGGDMDEDGQASDDSSPTDESTSEETLEKKAERRKRKEEVKAKRRRDAKTMGLQYFLEMVDLKHRYGSNLRSYHEVWKKADTNENFFYWLDFGEGRNVELESCPRERLDREQVRYLSREERQYYLVKVDDKGRLCWAKNGIRIDTTEQWRDSVHGIVPADDPTPAFHSTLGKRKTGVGAKISSSNSADSEPGPSEGEIEAAQAAKYATPGLDQAPPMSKIKHISAATIFDKLLRKSVRKNTWIFVADTSFRLYVGIKDSGAFQHSSFLQGSRISAAGLIKIRNGRLASLSPLSGHYRPPASNFRAFVHSLKDEGVDMSHVSISKAYAVLVGLEAYIKTRQKGKELVRRLARGKNKLVAPEEVRRQDEEARDKSRSAQREREILEMERKRIELDKEESKVTNLLMRKLNITAPQVSSERGGDREQGEGVHMASPDRSDTTIGAVCDVADLQSGETQTQEKLIIPTHALREEQTSRTTKVFAGG